MFRAVGGEKGFDQRRGQPAVGGGHSADLVARGFDGPRFMDVDMTGPGGNHGFIGLEQGFRSQQIGLGAAGEEMHVRARGFTELPDQRGGLLTDGVQTIAAGLAQAAFRDGFQDSGMGTLAVIVAKAVHRGSTSRK